MAAETLAEVATAAPWLSDPVIRYLLAHDHSIAEAHLLPEMPAQAELIV